MARWLARRSCLKHVQLNNPLNVRVPVSTRSAQCGYMYFCFDFCDNHCDVHVILLCHVLVWPSDNPTRLEARFYFQK